jgi:protocatechuate 3,4-dioxygenase, alpha subunit
MSGITPSQTVGPFFAYGLTPEGRADWKPGDVYAWKTTVGDDLVTPDAAGDRIRIEGRVLDGDGAPVNDAMIEIWQADAQGRYAHPRDKRANPNAAFKGFGRSATNAEGAYGFSTVRPGAVPDENGARQAPHIVVAVFSRGMLRQLYTRIYFSDAAENANDPVLKLVPEDRRGTLIARREDAGAQALYRFDIRLQGDDETVFFEV